MSRYTRKKWPPIDEVHRRLRYDPYTGEIHFRTRKVREFEGMKRPAETMCKVWNSRLAGKTWGHPNKSGHIKSAVCDIEVYAHHVAWAIMTGEWPTLPVRHINGDPADNRWINLEAVSQSDVCKNQSLHRDNNSGQSGVFRRKDTGKWVARIGSGKTDEYRYLGGAFETFAEAALARQRAEAEFGYHENHGKRPSRFDEPAHTSQKSSK